MNGVLHSHEWDFGASAILQNALHTLARMSWHTHVVSCFSSQWHCMHMAGHHVPAGTCASNLRDRLIAGCTTVLLGTAAVFLLLCPFAT
jgi:hypothetical protein